MFGGNQLDGEYNCIAECLWAIPENDFIGDDQDLDTCADQCGALECSSSAASPVSKSLARCLLGVDNPAENCGQECQLNPFFLQ